MDKLQDDFAFHFLYAYLFSVLLYILAMSHSDLLLLHFLLPDTSSISADTLAVLSGPFTGAVIENIASGM